MVSTWPRRCRPRPSERLTTAARQIPTIAAPVMASLNGTPVLVAISSENAAAVWQRSLHQPVIFAPGRVNDAPAAGQRPETDRRVCAQHDPEGNVERLDIAGGEQHAGDDAHGFLRVVGAVIEAEERGRKQLQAPEPAVDPRGRRPAEQPEDRGHDAEAEHQADERRQHHEDQGQGPAAGQYRDEAGLRHCRACTAASAWKNWSADRNTSDDPHDRATRPAKRPQRSPRGCHPGADEPRHGRAVGAAATKLKRCPDHRLPGESTRVDTTVVPSWRVGKPLM